MNVYFDLSILGLMMLSFVSLYFIKVLLNIEVKKRYYAFNMLINGLMIFMIYINFFWSLLIMLVVNFIMISLFFNKNRGTIIILYFFSFFMLEAIESLLCKNLKLLNCILIVTKPEAVLYLLITPIFGISLLVSSIFVDKVYRLGNYKVKAIVTKNEKKAIFDCYFDSGNTLKYKNIPVIFCNKKNWILDYDDIEKIEISSVNASSELESVKALIEIEDSNESFFVYVALVSEIKMFHGCEMLLNAYLL